MEKAISLSLSLSSKLRRYFNFQAGTDANHNSRPAAGFTIVELLVVIVVIAILAAITIVSYTGISSRAVVSSLQSDLTNASTQLKMFQTENSAYPTANVCPTPGATQICLKSSSGNSFAYLVSNTANPQTFLLTATNGTKVYSLTNDSAPAAWITIGSQTWAPTNLNVGVMVTGVTTQTNNSIVEKYCYNDLESNCTTYGGLYQWDEAMQYVTTDGAQGICPAGSHIPSDTDWKTLEMALGMSQAEADATGWRGTHLEGTQLKPGGSSGLNLPLAGRRSTDGSFGSLSSSAYLWSSSESSTSAWLRSLYSGLATVYRYTDTKAYGFSVSCLEN